MDLWNTTGYDFGFDMIEGSEESLLLRKLDRRENGSLYTSTKILYGVHGLQETPTFKFRWPEQIKSPQKDPIKAGSGLHVKEKLEFRDSSESCTSKTPKKRRFRGVF